MTDEPAYQTLPMDDLSEGFNVFAYGTDEEIEDYLRSIMDDRP